LKQIKEKDLEDSLPAVGKLIVLQKKMNVHLYLVWIK